VLVARCVCVFLLNLELPIRLLFLFLFLNFRIKLKFIFADSMAPRKVASKRPRDSAWEHCVRVNPDDDHRIVCNYCNTNISGGINRLKYHLARIPCKGVGTCDNSPPEIQIQMKASLDAIKEAEAKRAKAKQAVSAMGRSEFQGTSSVAGHSTASSTSPLSPFFLPRTSPGSQPSLHSFDEKKKKEADMAVRRFWYHDSLPFNYAKSPFLQPMVDAIASAGPGYKFPSYNSLRGKELDEELECVKQQLESIKKSWKNTGCTIMSDGWTDQRGRTIINFVVACPQGTMFLKSVDASSHVKNADLICSLLAEVVEEVGVENVVQVITDNAANYVLAGKLLCNKYPTIFWTPCAAHCIDLMLEDIGKLEWVQNVVQECKHITKYIYNHAWVLSLMRQFTDGELSRPAVTRFATNFLSLQSLLDQYQGLRRMFCSQQWLFWKDGTKPDAMSVKLSVFKDDLWDKVTEIVSMSEPLVKVLRIMDGDKPAMGYIYEGMDRAKESIKAFYKGDSSKYLPIWRIIDSRWDRQLHSPLHAAGAYLNPSIFYHEGSNVRRDPEVMRGVMMSIEKMYTDIDMQDKINMQRDLYKGATGMFGYTSTIRLRDRKMPCKIMFLICIC